MSLTPPLCYCSTLSHCTLSPYLPSLKSPPSPPPPPLPLPPPPPPFTYHHYHHYHHYLHQHHHCTNTITITVTTTYITTTTTITTIISTISAVIIITQLINLFIFFLPSHSASRLPIRSILSSILENWRQSKSFRDGVFAPIINQSNYTYNTTFRRDVNYLYNLLDYARRVFLNIDTRNPLNKSGTHLCVE